MQRGIRGDQELDPSMLLRDTRTMGQRILDFFKNPANVAMILAVLGGGSFLFTTSRDISAFAWRDLVSLGLSTKTNASFQTTTDG